MDHPTKAPQQDESIGDIMIVSLILMTVITLLVLIGVF
jgi:Tfp pilus assembly protein PilX